MTHIRQRRDTAANWTSANPTLMLGEIGRETDTLLAKSGDGVTPWNDLDYLPAGPVGPPPTMVAGDATSVVGGPASVDVNDLGGGTYSIDLGVPLADWAVAGTNTVAPGTPAEVTLGGTDFEPTLTFDIPEGEKGDKGDQGDQGIQGIPGETPSLRGLSVTSTTIGTGSKTFAISPAMNVAFPVGATVKVQGASAANYMVGVVTAATTASVTVNVTEVGGSGTFASWTLVLGAYKGLDGTGQVNTVNSVAPVSGNVDVQRLIRSAWSANGDGTTTNKYAKLATIVVNNGNEDAVLSFSLSARYTSAVGIDLATLMVRLRNPSSFPNAPHTMRVEHLSGNWAMTNGIKLINTVQGASSNTFELWWQVPVTFTALSLFELHRVFSANVTVTYESNAAWQTSMTTALVGPATPVHTYVDLTTAQSILGNKTFNDNLAVVARAGLSTPRLTLSHAVNGADGLLLTQTGGATQGSPRIFFQTTSGSNAIFRTDEGEFRFTVGASIGANSGTVKALLNDSGDFRLANRLTLGALTDPTHTLTLPNGATGYAHYNTADQATNYERARAYWSGNVFTLGNEAAGAGVFRPVRLASSGSYSYTIYPEGTHKHEFVAVGSTNILRITSTSLSAATGTQNALVVDPTINQSGTASYRGIYVNVTETATGSGEKYLLDLAVNGTSRARVENSGIIRQVLASAGANAHALYVTGDTNSRFSVNVNGLTTWGPGNAATDTNFYRSGVGALKTDGTFQSSGLIGSVGLGIPTTSFTTVTVGVSTITPTMQRLGVGASDSSNVQVRYSADANSSVSVWGKSRGSTLGNNTVVVNGDSLARLVFNGTDGTNLVEAARIDVSVDGVPATGSVPGRIDFMTTPVGGTNALNRLAIKPSGQVSLPSSNTSGLMFYNTVDEATNIERARFYWSSNVFNIGVENFGTGILRALQLSSGATTVKINPTAGVDIFRHGTSISYLLGVTSSGLNSTNSVQYGILVNPAINQTGTAGYTAIRVDVTETATGSGTKRLLDLAVGGSSRFYVEKSGSTLSSVGFYVNTGTAVAGAAINGAVLEFGDGTVARDTNLYRSAVGVLKTDGTFDAVTELQENGVRVYSPNNLPALVEAYTFSMFGYLYTQTGVSRIYLENDYTVVSVRAAVNTAPTGAAVVVDVNKNGTTIYTTQANRPSIAASGNTATGNSPDVTTFSAGDYITVDLDQIGSTVAGADLTVTIRLLRSV